MKNSNLSKSPGNTKEGKPNLVIGFANWLKKRGLATMILTAGLVVMLLWAGSFKMTPSGAESITPFVTNSPLISWHFKLFGALHGSDIIGATEVIAALLIIAGQFKPQIGIIGALIATLMFFITSTMIITTPATVVNINGVDYLSFLGLFLFKDIISLGASIYLVGHFGQKAAESLQ
ncbi:MAG TPA: DUF417 family protein [Mucilaginibacter sp.]